MNPVDIGIIAVLGVFVLWGLYRGFIQSILNLGSGIVSFFVSFKLFPKLAEALSANTEITRFISTYTNSQSLLGDLSLSNISVNYLTPENISQVIDKAHLPAPLDTLLKYNLSSKVFSPLGDLATNVGDYVNQTLLSVSINVLSFIICFIGCLLLSAIIVNVLRSVFRYPVLRHADSLVGGAAGFLLGVMVCYIILTVLPLAESVVPIPEFEQLIAESTLAQALKSNSLIIAVMNRKL